MAENSNAMTHLQALKIEDTIPCDVLNQVVIAAYPCGGVEVCVSFDWLRRGRPRKTREFDQARVFSSLEDAVPFIRESLAWVRPNVGPPKQDAKK